MNLSEIRRSARENLNGKWKTAVVFMLICLAIDIAIDISCLLFSFVPGFGIIITILTTVISVPLAYGIISIFMNIKRDTKICYLDYWQIAYKNFKRAWCITGNILKKLWVYLLIYVCLIFSIFFASFGILLLSIIFESRSLAILSCLILLIISIAMIAVLVLLTIKEYYYVLAYFIAIDNPDMSAKDAVENSYELMQGHRAEYFLLDLSFIGWGILAMLTLGIGLLWLIPYIYISQIIFYEILSGKQSVKVTKSAVPNDVEKAKIENPKKDLLDFNEITSKEANENTDGINN